MRDFPAKLAALLILAAFFTAAIAANDIDPRQGLARFGDGITQCLGLTGSTDMTSTANHDGRDQ